MSDKTGINWTESTWNYTRGCSMIAPECHNCYAMNMAYRFHGPGQPYEGLVKKVGDKIVWTGKVITVPHMLEEPLRWQRPRLIFVDSMSDLLHESLGLDEIQPAFQVMHDASWHIFQLLTKRIERAPDLLSSITLRNGRNLGRDPLPNVWIGTSVGSEKTAMKFIPALAQTPAALRWLSAEPLIAPTDWGRWIPASKCQWIVFGGESQKGHREMKEEWLDEGIAVARQHGIAIHVKQMGESWAINNLLPAALKADRKAGKIENIPARFAIREYPIDVQKALAWDGRNHATGRVLIELPVLTTAA